MCDAFEGVGGGEGRDGGREGVGLSCDVWWRGRGQ